MHGNSDIAFGRGEVDGHKEWQTGFRGLAGYLLGQGYSSAELYTFTWGDGDPEHASLTYHRKKVLEQLRLFIQAVLAYTGAGQVDVVGHSMGVTLARKALAGGVGIDQTEGRYDLGAPLTPRVRKLVAIAGANLGLVACYSAEGLPTCSNIDGFYPGATPLSGPSHFLKGLTGH